MSLFKLDALIGEGARGVVRRVGNQPITAGAPGGGRRRKRPDGANLGAMVAGSPEVMVKVSGFGRGKGVRNALEYIARDGQLELETPEGGKVKGKEEIAELAKQWAQGDRRKHPRQRDTVNLVLSMPPGTDPEKVLKASRGFAEAEFKGKRDYVLVQHTDEKHPHVHIIAKMAGYDGRRLNPRKDDLQAWRETFAEELRDLGEDCAATPRRARGVARKAQDQTLVHMRKRGLQPRVDAAEIRDAVQHQAAGGAPRPWDLALQRKQDEIRQIYRRGAEQLKAIPNRDDQELARKLEAFVRAMPPPETRRDLFLKKLAEERIRDAIPATPDRGPGRG